MAILRSAACFAAGVALGALGREALPKLQEKFPLLKEQLDPVLAAAVTGARDAAGDACSLVTRQVSEVVGSFQEAMARRPTHSEPRSSNSSAA